MLGAGEALGVRLQDFSDQVTPEARRLWRALAERDAEATPFVPANLEPGLLAFRTDESSLYKEGCVASYEATSIVDGCVFGDRKSTARPIVLLGDSHAAMWFPAVDAAAKDLGRPLHVVAKRQCAPSTTPQELKFAQRTYSECQEWLTDATEYVEGLADPTVLVGFRADRALEPAAQTQLYAGLEEELTRLGDDADTVVLAHGPELEREPDVCLSGALEDAARCGTTEEAGLDEATRTLQRKAAEAVGAEWLDVSAWQCPNDFCPAIIGNVPVFTDRHHVTATFAALTAEEMERHLSGR